MTTCPKCGNQAGEGAVFCDRCGTRLPQPEPSGPQAAPVSAGGSVICSACGAGNVPGEAFCDSCGSPLESPLPAAPAEAAAAPAGADLAPAPEPSPEAAATPEPAAAEPAVAAEPTAAPLAALACPACGATIVAGEAFCADCGASLAQPPIPPEPVTEATPETLPEAIAPAEVDVAPVAAAPEPTPAPAPPAPVACPACGAEVEPADKFCSNCGLGLALAPAGPVEPPAAAAAPFGVPAPVGPAGPRLVVVASGAEIVLPAKDEILIGREDPVSGLFPDADLAPHGGEDAGVSRRHARIVVEGGSYFIEDLNSTNYTFVNKVKLAPKTRQPLADGDEIRCGRAALIFRAA